MANGLSFISINNKTMKKILDGTINRVHKHVRNDEDVFPLGDTGDLIHIKESWRVADCKDETNEIVIQYQSDGTTEVKSCTNPLAYDAIKKEYNVVGVDNTSRGGWHIAAAMPMWLTRKALKITGLLKIKMSDVNKNELTEEGLMNIKNVVDGRYLWAIDFELVIKDS